MSPSREESLPRTSIVTGVSSAVDASSSTVSGASFSGETSTLTVAVSVRNPSEIV